MAFDHFMGGGIIDLWILERFLSPEEPWAFVLTPLWAVPLIRKSEENSSSKSPQEINGQ